MASRRLLLYNTTLPDTNCTPPSILEFPNDPFTQNQRQHGAVVLNFLVAFYMFWAVAVVCDGYFVPSLEVICDKLGLQTDVAGATLMALGSSAPELFASIIGKSLIGSRMDPVTGRAVLNQAEFYVLHCEIPVVMTMFPFIGCAVRLYFTSTIDAFLHEKGIPKEKFLETCWDLPPPASYLIISIVKVVMGQINIHSNFNTKSDQFQISPAVSPKILHYTV